MGSLSTELKAVITRHLHSASRAEVLAIASALTADDVPLEFRASVTDRSTPLIKIGAAGEQLERSATDWEAVLDTRTGLIWTRHYVGKRMPWAKAIEQPQGITVAGYTDWEAPSIRQQLSIVDYDRSSPAIHTDFFDVESNSDWCWSRTPVKSSPGDYAWYVSFGDGGAGWLPQSREGFVRGVRAQTAQPMSESAP